MTKVEPSTNSKNSDTTSSNNGLSSSSSFVMPWTLIASSSIILCGLSMYENNYLIYFYLLRGLPLFYYFMTLFIIKTCSFCIKNNIFLHKASIPLLANSSALSLPSWPEWPFTHCQLMLWPSIQLSSSIHRSLFLTSCLEEFFQLFFFQPLIHSVIPWIHI